VLIGRNRNEKRIAVFLGTRPEAIKLAPVIRELRDRNADVTVCSTGQHRQMLDAALGSFHLKPDRDLEVMTEKQNLTDLLGRLLLEIRPVLHETSPDVVVVQGDTATVMAASLAGFLENICVAHVEAGLRTGDRRLPFPEEINRRVTGLVADYHFVPTQRARKALLAEGVSASDIYLTGNTVVDALYWMRDKIGAHTAVPELEIPGRCVLVTAHRRESFGRPFRELCMALKDLAQRFEDVTLVFPVHLNPNVRGPVHEILADHPRIRLIDPVDYPAMVRLMLCAHLILTDSGGIQEEAPALGKPVLVLREKTERPEAVAAGAVMLVGTHRERIVRQASRLLDDDEAYARMARVTNVYGDGLAASRIADVLLQGSMDSEFSPVIE
jgi:UDP-N-acetylglucosamine 2-epimerase